MFKVKSNFPRLGFVQLPVILGLALMAITLPLVSQLVSQNQENRSKATECPCNPCSGDHPVGPDPYCHCVRTDGQDPQDSGRQNCSVNNGNNGSSGGSSCNRSSCGACQIADGALSFDNNSQNCYRCSGRTDGNGQFNVVDRSLCGSGSANPYVNQTNGNSGQIIATAAPSPSPSPTPSTIASSGGYSQSTIQGLCNQISCNPGQTKNAVYGSGGYSYCVCTSSCISDGNLLPSAGGVCCSGKSYTVTVSGSYQVKCGPSSTPSPCVPGCSASGDSITCAADGTRSTTSCNGNGCNTQTGTCNVSSSGLCSDLSCPAGQNKYFLPGSYGYYCGCSSPTLCVADGTFLGSGQVCCSQKSYLDTDNGVPKVKCGTGVVSGPCVAGCTPDGYEVSCVGETRSTTSCTYGCNSTTKKCQESPPSPTPMCPAGTQRSSDGTNECHQLLPTLTPTPSPVTGSCQSERTGFVCKGNVSAYCGLQSGGYKNWVPNLEENCGNNGCNVFSGKCNVRLADGTPCDGIGLPSCNSCANSWYNLGLSHFCGARPIPSLSPSPSPLPTISPSPTVSPSPSVSASPSTFPTPECDESQKASGDCINSGDTSKIPTLAALPSPQPTQTARKYFNPVQFEQDRFKKSEADKDFLASSCSNDNYAQSHPDECRPIITNYVQKQTDFLKKYEPGLVTACGATMENKDSSGCQSYMQEAAKNGLAVIAVSSVAALGAGAAAAPAQTIATVSEAIGAADFLALRGLITAQAAFSSLPAAAQSALITGGSLGTLGSMYLGFRECQINPQSDACIAVMADPNATTAMGREALIGLGAGVRGLTAAGKTALNNLNRAAETKNSLNTVNDLAKQREAALQEFVSAYKNEVNQDVVSFNQHAQEKWKNPLYKPNWVKENFPQFQGSSDDFIKLLDENTNFRATVREALEKGGVEAAIQALSEKLTSSGYNVAFVDKKMPLGKFEPSWSKSSLETFNSNGLHVSFDGMQGPPAIIVRGDQNQVKKLDTLAHEVGHAIQFSPGLPQSPNPNIDLPYNVRAFNNPQVSPRFVDINSGYVGNSEMVSTAAGLIADQEAAVWGRTTGKLTPREIEMLIDRAANEFALCNWINTGTCAGR